MRRWIVLGLIAGMTLVAAAPASADRPGKAKLTSDQAAAVTVGDTVWLAFTWKAEGDLENFRVAARRDDGAEISYPENTGTYSARYQSAHLRDGEIDYTAILVHVPETARASRTKSLVLQLEASWDGGQRRRSSKHTVKIPLAVYEGSDVAQVTDSIEVPAGDGAWVEIACAGMAPMVERFSVVVNADRSLPVTYPGYGSGTSLHHDAVLEDGETDVVRFYVDASDATAGEYHVQVFATYARGGEPGGVEGAVSIIVVP